MITDRIAKGFSILWGRLTQQGVGTTALWAADHATRIIVDPTSRRGKPYRGVRLPIEAILQAIADRAPAARSEAICQ